MKLIKAYIRHVKAEEVYNTLVQNGFCCMTMVDCEGTGQYSDREDKHVSEKYPFADAYRVIKLEILVEQASVEQVTGLIRAAGRTGYRGDGMIIVSPVDKVYKIKTDEEGIHSI